jgi:hypothetical protein
MLIVQNIKRTRLLSMNVYRNGSNVSQISLEKFGTASKLTLFRYVSKYGKKSFSLTYKRPLSETIKYKNLPMKVNIVPGDGRKVIGYILALEQYSLK